MYPNGNMTPITRIVELKFLFKYFIYGLAWYVLALSHWTHYIKTDVEYVVRQEILYGQQAIYQ